MARKSDILNLIRSVLIVLSFLLAIAVVAFQYMEIEKYQIQDDMFERISNMFESAPAEASDSGSSEASGDATAEGGSGEVSIPKSDGSGSSESDADLFGPDDSSDNSDSADSE